MRGDADGEFWNIVIGAVVGGLCGVISSYFSGEEVSIGTFVSGAMMGALGAVTSFKYVAAAVNCVVTVTVGGITGVIRKDKPKTSHTSSNSHRTKRSTYHSVYRMVNGKLVRYRYYSAS